MHANALVEIAQLDSAAHLRAVWPRSSPEVLEPLGRQLGVSHSVLDVPVAKVGLQGARIVSLVGKRKAAGVPQHVGVSLEAQSSLHASALDHAGKAGRGEGRAALR